MAVLLSIALYGAIIAFLYWRFINRRYHRSDIYFMRIYDSVKELNDTVDQLKSLEGMISDIEICNHNHLKAVRIEIPESLSPNCKHEVIINGRDTNSKYLLRLAVSERNRLRCSLQREIAHISRYGVTERVTQTIPKVEADSGRGGR